MPSEDLYSLKGKRIWVAGHGGMVGSALVRRLQSEDCELILADRHGVDLRDQQATRAWVKEHRPQGVFVAAAKVGGILANDTAPADFLYDNLMIEANVIEAAARYDVEKLLFLGSSCIYPKLAPQPIPEEALLSGPLEPTNQWYAIAKIAGIKLCESYRRQFGHDFISAMPTNLYGFGDNFELNSSHVLPALMAKAHDAKISGKSTLEVWGTGNPLREFLFADDCADALVFLMTRYSGDMHVNVGSGEDLTIASLARLVCDVVGFEGELRFDTTKPDGSPRKLMSADRLRALGWSPSTSLRDGVERTYQWFLENHCATAGA